MGTFTQAKQTVLEYFDALKRCTPEQCGDVLAKYMAEDYDWRGVYPFRQQYGTADVAEKFWAPLKRALSDMQRRMDIFFAGNNIYGEYEGEQWVVCTGNFMGNFDADWLGIRHTRKVNCLRFAEFNCVKDGKITKTGLFVDILGFMQMAGINPLPLQTAQFYVYPGPRGHNGLLYEDQPPEQAASMMKLIYKMFDKNDKSTEDPATNPYYKDIPQRDIPTVLNYRRVCTDDFTWFGPAGIGACYTLPRYAEQHCAPFAAGLSEGKFNGHKCFTSEGNFAAFFGWPNLTHTPTGGYLGMPGSFRPTDMQVVDVYSREDGRVAENWIYIDFLYWFKQQGLDLLERTKEILNP